jgi:hypothetical protein
VLFVPEALWAVLFVVDVLLDVDLAADALLVLPALFTAAFGAAVLCAVPVTCPALLASACEPSTVRAVLVSAT